jgi:N4-(beta-N-acetylglucosaminyl)-L-asparaginase
MQTNAIDSHAAGTSTQPVQGPVVLATWSFGRLAAQAAWPVLAGGGEALDAAIAGCDAVESDPAVDSVGVGGIPDASGRVSVDACVMRSPAQCGAVCFVRGIEHPARLARTVMERTVHIMLAGEGAEQFGARHGHARHPTELLTPGAQRVWQEWKAGAGARATSAQGREGELPPMNVEERYAAERRAQLQGSAHGLTGAQPDPLHDTVCVLTRDAQGCLAGAVTTSGLGFKVPGRVGDSPIIGHGLYVDPAVGAVAATGNGELIMSTCGSFLGVEFLRAGRAPGEALLGVLARIAHAHALRPEHQVGLIALTPDGRWASAALRPGFAACIASGAGLTSGPAQHVLLS